MAIPATDPYLTVCWPHPRTMYGQDFGERLSREVGMTIRALLVGSIVEEACDIGVAIGRLDLEREGVIAPLLSYWSTCRVRERFDGTTAHLPYYALNAPLLNEGFDVALSDDIASHVLCFCKSSEHLIDWRVTEHNM